MEFEEGSGDMTRVLVADADPDSSGFIRRILQRKKLGSYIEVVIDGREALGRLSSRQFDLAIIDIFMPYISGLEVVRQLRKDGITTRIILLSENASVEQAREAVWSGAQDFVEKPILPDSFSVAVQNLLNSRTFNICTFVQGIYLDNRSEEQSRRKQSYSET